MARRKKDQGQDPPAAPETTVAVAEPEAATAPVTPEQTEQKPIIDTVETRRNLRCFLTEHEKSEASEAMARAVLHLTDLDEQKKAAAGQFTSQIKEANATVQKYAKLLSNGHEFREVPCKVTKDYTSGRIVVVRLDTGEFVEDRAMSDLECQIPLRLRQPEPAEKWVSGEEALGAAAPAGDPAPSTDDGQPNQDEPTTDSEAAPSSAPPLQLVPEPEPAKDDDDTPWDEDVEDEEAGGEPDDEDDDDWLDDDEDEDDE